MLIPAFALALIALFIAINAMIETDWTKRAPLLLFAGVGFGAAFAVGCLS